MVLYPPGEEEEDESICFMALFFLLLLGRSFKFHAGVRENFIGGTLSRATFDSQCIVLYIGYSKRLRSGQKIEENQTGLFHYLFAFHKV